MTLLERPREDTLAAPVPTEQRSHRWALVVLVTVLALVLGGVGGWMIRGETETPGILVAGTGEPTARQEQMLDQLRAYEKAWQASDAEAVLAFFTPNGWATMLGNDYRIDDGSLRSYIGQGDWSPIDMLEPVLVNGDELLFFHRYGEAVYTDVMTFTPVGDLLMISHVVGT
jgi:hypothetical protein